MPHAVHTYRRTLFVASNLVPPGVLLTASRADAASPRLAELERRFGAAFAVVIETFGRAAEALNTGSDDADELDRRAAEDWSGVALIAQEIMTEPVATPADLAIKAAVWEAAMLGAEAATTITTFRAGE
jgi:hypothetical protein